MPGIKEWLSSHGLPEYADRFAANRIDLSILPDLSDEDLRELGVLLGDRRRDLIAAVTGLNTRVPQKLRVGIATGVVVGNLAPGIVGETPNLAARLQPSPSRTRSSSAKVREGFLAICSSSKTSG